MIDIDLYIHIYISNKAIRVAKLCFYCLKKPHINADVM